METFWEEVLNWITANFIPVVAVICLVVGYVIKHTPIFEKVANNYIPLIVVVLGGILGCVATQEISLVAIGGGMLSGLISTGFHQLIKQIIEKVGGNKNE